MSLELSRVTVTILFLEPNLRAAAARDPDDNKYVDAYVVAQADLLISNNSKDFSVLKNIDFPPINWKTVRQVKKINVQIDTKKYNFQISKNGNRI